MKKIGILFALIGSYAYAGHPRYNCSFEEIRAVSFSEPIYSSVVSSGGIKSIVAVNGSYELKTDKCTVVVDLNYLPDDGSNKPCPSFELRVIKSECI